MLGSSDSVARHTMKQEVSVNLAKVDLLYYSHALKKCGLFENVEMNMIPMENGDIIRFRVTGYEIADVRNPDPPKEWTGVMIGGPNDTHVVLHCERERREAGAVWVALENVINNDTLGVPTRAR